MEKVNTKIVNIFLIIISIFFIVQIINISENIIDNLISIIIPIVLSFFISYSLYPCSKYLNKKISYNLSSFIVIIIFFLVVFLLIYFSIITFSKEIYLIKDEIYYFLSKTSFISNDLKESLLSLDKSIILLNKGTSIITDIIIIIVLSIYFLFSMEDFKKVIKKYPFLSKIDKELFLYYKGFYLIIVIEIIEYTLIYYIIGHPYFLFLGFLSGITSIIPIFGALITNALALITSLNISKTLFIMTSITMIIVPLFNSYVIEPHIYNKTLKISLISIILSVFIFGSLLGLIGVILAIPLYIIIKNILKYLITKKKT